MYSDFSEISELSVIPQQTKNSDIDDQYPEASSQGTCKFIPLHSLYIVGKAISESEPGPFNIPVKMKKFESEPEYDPGEVSHASGGVAPD